MNVILMTVLLTLLGAGLIVLLVWLSLSSRRSEGFRKTAKVQINDLNEKINNEIKYVYDNIGDYKTQVSHEFEELHRGVIGDIYKEMNDNQEQLDRRFEKLESSIDSRFDKLQNLLKTQITPNPYVAGVNALGEKK